MKIMSVLRQRLSLNKFFAISFASAVIFISGCGSVFPGLHDKDTVEETVDFDKLTESYEMCRGKGSVESGGVVKGKLSFEFTAAGENGFIQFYDLLGRKTLFISLKNESVSAWDMVRNEQYDTSGILTALPFTQLITPVEFFQVLWGSIPLTYGEGRKDNDLRFESTSASISFDSRRTEYGPLLHKIVLESKEENYRVTIEIKEREMDASYPHLQRRIPDSVPFAAPA